MKEFSDRMNLLLITAGVFLIGCATASVEQPTGFLKNYSKLKEGKFFLQQYVNKKIDLSKYDSVKVAPVDFDYLINRTVCSSDDLEGLGHDFRKNIEEELTKAGFNVTQVPTDRTLIVCTAITNIEVPDTVFNAAKSLAPYGIGFVPTDTDGKTAFEAEITDVNGKIIAQMAEKQAGAGGNLDVGALAVGGYIHFVNTRVVFKSWAEKIAKMMSEYKENKAKK